MSTAGGPSSANGINAEETAAYARGFSAAELAARGLDDLPDELVSARHLIYSSPATLAFNSPGAEGFGVKRAGLAIPGSVMLVVAPGCCGRNTSLVSDLPAYSGRFFYLNLDETDIVTGRHLRKIPQAVEEVVASLPQPPSVVMICITCVDALLGTDMERVCRRAEERAGVPVRPCYMYALTREGRRPPMVHVRQSLYSMFEPRRKEPRAANLLGFFAPLVDDCELYRYLEQMGVRHVREVSRCASFDEFLQMAEANFNLVLHPEARMASADLEERLRIPSIELTRLYQIDRIRTQYQALGQVLGTTFDDEADYRAAEAAIEAFRAAHAGATFAVGECANADPFELALALTRYGFEVREVFGTLGAENFVFLRRLAEKSPATCVYSNMEPTMIHYDAVSCPVDVAVGKDACWYHPEAAHLDWNSDIQPYGYAGVRRLFEALLNVLESRNASEAQPTAKCVLAPKPALADSCGVSGEPGQPGGRVFRLMADGTGPTTGPLPPSTGGTITLVGPSLQAQDRCAVLPSHLRGFRKHLTPFAPDQSGAVSVLYELGGIVVVCDAGGCTGNICGFDEPRWHDTRSAVFSAGLRDMDAILGRDEKLVAELADAASKIDARFAAVVGTPVPAVIGTDYRALSRMAQRRSGLPTIAVEATGTHLYDAGASKAYVALAKRFATEAHSVDEGRIGVLGATPLDLDDATLRMLTAMPGTVCYGASGTLDDLTRASAAEKNLVVAPSGLAAARLLKERFGTPYEMGYPLSPKLEGLLNLADVAGKRVLVVHQQVAANAVRDYLLAAGAAKVTVATWFTLDAELARPQDVHLAEEADFVELVGQGNFDLLIGDPVLWPLVPTFAGTTLDLPHFPVSGKHDPYPTVGYGPLQDTCHVVTPTPLWDTVH